MRLDSGAVPQTNLFEDGALHELEERRTAVFCPKTVTPENGNIPLVYATRKADRLLGAEDDNFFNLVGAIYSSDGEVLSGPIGFATNVKASFDVAVLGNGDVAIASDPKVDTELFVDPNDLNDDAILSGSKAVSLERHKIKDVHTASATLVAHGESGFSLAFVKDEEVDIPGGPIAGTIDAFNRKEIKVLPVEESVETSTLGPVGVRAAVQIDFTRLENGNTVKLVDRDGEDGVRSKFDALVFIPGDAAIRTVQISGGARIFDVTVEALVGGGFVVVYAQTREFRLINDRQDTDIRVEAFAADGSALTGPMRVGNSGGNDRDISPEIGALDDGGFMVFYDRNRKDEGLYAQRFAADASAAGKAFQVFAGRVGDSSAIELEDSRVAVSFETHSAGIRTEIIEGETLRSFVNAASADPANDVEGDVLRNIENVVGSALDGRLFGSDGINVTDGGEGDDKLDGKDGADTIIGGGGNDLISATNAKGRTFDGGEGTDTLRLVGNDNLRDDTLLSIERLEIQSSASRVSKVILGESQLADLELDTCHSDAGRDANIEVVAQNAGLDISGLAFHGVGRGDEFVLRGTAAADVITGSAIRDVIKAGGDRDTLDGGAGRERPEGGDGDVLLIGGAGNDSILGGAGRDEVLHAGSAAAVQVSLLDENIREIGGDAEGDKLISVENVTGSVLADTLVGNQAANALRGGGGNDLLSGEGGADELRGEVGNDILIARNAVGSVFDGGEGSDILGVVGSGAFRGNSLEDIEALEIVAVAGQGTRVPLNLSEAKALGSITALPADDAQELFKS